MVCHVNLLLMWGGCYTAPAWVLIIVLAFGLVPFVPGLNPKDEVVDVLLSPSGCSQSNDNTGSFAHVHAVTSFRWLCGWLLAFRSFIISWASPYVNPQFQLFFGAFPGFLFPPLSPWPFRGLSCFCLRVTTDQPIIHTSAVCCGFVRHGEKMGTFGLAF